MRIQPTLILVAALFIQTLGVSFVVASGLPKFVEVQQDPDSIVTYDGFYQFITPIVKAQQKYLRESIKENGMRETPEEVALLFNSCYLSALDEMKLAEHSDVIERFIVLAFTQMEMPKLHTGCLHYFRAMGVLKPESLEAISSYIHSKPLSKELLPLFYQNFVEYGLGGGKVSMPLESKRELLQLLWENVDAADGQSAKFSESLFAVNVSSDLVLNESINDSVKSEIGSRILKSVEDWKRQNHNENALNLLDYASSKFRLSSESLPLQMNINYIESALGLFDSFIQTGGKHDEFERIGKIIQRSSTRHLQTHGTESEIYDLLRQTFLSESIDDTVKVFIAPNFLFVGGPSEEVINQEVLRLWRDKEVTRAMRYELLFNLIDGNHPEFNSLILEEVSFYEQLMDIKPDQYGQSESDRFAFLTGQLGRKLKMNEVDEGYFDYKPMRRLELLLVSGRLEQLK